MHQGIYIKLFIIIYLILDTLFKTNLFYSYILFFIFIFYESNNYVTFYLPHAIIYEYLMYILSMFLLFLLLTLYLKLYLFYSNSI